MYSPTPRPDLYLVTIQPQLMLVKEMQINFHIGLRKQLIKTKKMK